MTGFSYTRALTRAGEEQQYTTSANASHPTLFDQPTPPIPTTPATPDPWLIRHLVAAGHLTETGLSRRARPRPCPTCHTWTLTGLDDDLCAFEATCDPAPLTTLGEALALIAGRRTLALRRTRGRLELDQRWADHIEAEPAGSPRLDVLATHTCGHPIPTAWTAPSAFTPPPAAHLPAGSPAPF